MKIIVDRTIKDIVICQQENKTMINIPLLSFDKTPIDGDIFEYADDQAVYLEGETIERKNKIQNRFNRLKRK